MQVTERPNSGKEQLFARFIVRTLYNMCIWNSRLDFEGLGLIVPVPGH